jgi:hypothetical protein
MANKTKKEISTLTGIIIIVVVTVVLFGGVFAYSYLAFKKQVKFAVVPPTSPSLSTQQILNKPFPLAGEPTDQTADWKTYTNTQYGFEIKYPQNWFIKQNPDEAFPNITVAFSPISFSEMEGYFNSDVSGSGLEFQGDFLGTIKIYLSNMDNYDCKSDSGEERIIGSNTWCEFAVDKGDPGINHFLKTLSPDKKTLVEILEGGTISTDPLDIYNQVVSTFKFTK